MEDMEVRESGRPNKVGNIEYRKERASIMEWEGPVQVYKKNNEEMDGIIREDRKGTGDQGNEELMTMEYPISEKCGNEGDMVINSIVIGKGGEAAEQAKPIRIPLIECTNRMCAGEQGKVPTKKNSTKGQWKRRAKLQG